LDALEGDKAQLVAALKEGPRHPDDLAQATSLPVERLLGLLLELELSGDIVQTADNQFALP
jgi:predicted Rossmann fold nucleotide-binding protein DprA/Smf involved in DNA uptake